MLHVLIGINNHDHFRLAYRFHSPQSMQHATRLMIHGLADTDKQQIATGGAEWLTNIDDFRQRPPQNRQQ